MSQDEAVHSVADALRGLEARQAEARERHRATLAEFDAEIERLQQSIANLQAQLEAVQHSRAEADAAGIDASDADAGAGYRSIFQALTHQSSRLAQRAVAWTESSRALAQQRAEALRGSDVASLVEEYEQFVSGGEAALQAVPASYRKVIEAHHQQVCDQLRERLSGLDHTPVVEGDPVAYDVVVAVDDDPDEGGIAMIVTPVAAEVHVDWSSRDADLLTRIAARVVEGLYTALRGTPMEAAQAMFGGHQGLLALEVELPPGQAEGFGQRLQSALDESLGADELGKARVEARVTAVSVDLLLPPDDADDMDDEEVDDA